MASLQYCIFGVLLVVLLFVQSGNSISCYECASRDDPRCSEDILPAEFKIDCSTKKGASNFTLCRKIQQWVDFDIQELKAHDRIIRKCGWDDSAYTNRCYYKAGFGGRQEVCTCQNELCNNSPSRDAFAVLVISVSALAIFRTLF